MVLEFGKLLQRIADVDNFTLRIRKQGNKSNSMLAHDQLPNIPDQEEAWERAWTQKEVAVLRQRHGGVVGEVAGAGMQANLDGRVREHCLTRLSRGISDSRGVERLLHPPPRTAPRLTLPDVEHYLAQLQAGSRQVGNFDFPYEFDLPNMESSSEGQTAELARAQTLIDEEELLARHAESKEYSLLKRLNRTRSLRKVHIIPRFERIFGEALKQAANQHDPDDQQDTVLQDKLARMRPQITLDAHHRMLLAMEDFVRRLLIEIRTIVKEMNGLVGRQLVPQPIRQIRRRFRRILAVKRKLRREYAQWTITTPSQEAIVNQSPASASESASESASMSVSASVSASVSVSVSPNAKRAPPRLPRVPPSFADLSVTPEMVAMAAMRLGIPNLGPRADFAAIINTAIDSFTEEEHARMLMVPHVGETGQSVADSIRQELASQHCHTEMVLNLAHNIDHVTDSFQMPQTDPSTPLE